MRTPIWDFVREYASSDTARLHMPGHKGKGELEKFDITEISGADSLYEADGIIAESERNASEIFGSATYYSTEGSSLAIKAMLCLAAQQARTDGKRPLILAGRNAHRAFLSAAALLDLDVSWLPSGEGYMSCRTDPEELAATVDAMPRTPAALYLTSPDYLGNTADIKGISKVCHDRGILLLVDNAHGAYLKFLTPSRHPIDLGADMCADSAHKTLPVLTGGAYLHVCPMASQIFEERVRSALALFGSTSPSYLILSSLDKVNPYLKEQFPRDLTTFISKIRDIKSRLAAKGFSLVGDEEAKITIDATKYGYTGYELAALVRSCGAEPEMADPIHLVLMPSPAADIPDAPINALLALERRESLDQAPTVAPTQAVLSLREAMLSPAVSLPTEECVGRILADATLSCPPAVPILIPGELIREDHLPTLAFYGKDRLTVIK